MSTSFYLVKVPFIFKNYQALLLRVLLATIWFYFKVLSFLGIGSDGHLEKIVANCRPTSSYYWIVGSQTFPLILEIYGCLSIESPLYLLTLSRLGVFGRKEFGSGGGTGGGGGGGGGAERAQAQRIDFQSLIGGSLQKARL